MIWPTRGGMGCVGAGGVDRLVDYIRATITALINLLLSGSSPVSRAVDVALQGRCDRGDQFLGLIAEPVPAA